MRRERDEIGRRRKRALKEKDDREEA